MNDVSQGNAMLPWEKVAYADFRRAAQRFFIASDSRFLPSSVKPPRVFLLVGAWRILTAVTVLIDARVLVVPCLELTPSSAAIARLSRSVSFLNSAMIS
jgi:hypothetical protein